MRTSEVASGVSGGQMYPNRLNETNPVREHHHDITPGDVCAIELEPKALLIDASMMACT